MIKEDCPHLCEVISSGEKVKACRQDEYTVNTYFSCDNCKRDKKAVEFTGTSNLDCIKKGNTDFNPNEISLQLSKFIPVENINYDEKENKFTAFMDYLELSSEGIRFDIDNTINLSPEALEYILKVIQLLKNNKK